MTKLKTALQIIQTYKNWPTYLSDYYVLTKKPTITYELRNGIKYKTRPKTSDRTIINETWIHHIYTPEDTFKIQPHDTVVDIGAHIGFFSIFASSHAKEGKVFAFEPTPVNFAMLEENIRINKLNNIIALNQAVGGKDGTAEIFLSEHNTGGHSFFHTKKNSENSITVPVISLENFMKKYNLHTIDFLKMDCEGAEYPILFNASKETLAKVKKISMEYHMVENNSVEKLQKHLEHNGFIVKVLNDSRRMLYAYRA